MPNNRTSRRGMRRLCLWLIAAIVVACYAVPYLLIGNIGAWYGSFLFWCIAGVMVILLNAGAMAGLRDKEDDG